MDIRHITALKDEMFCHAANLSGILFMAVDIANQWLFYVDSDNHVLMQYSMIFNATTAITDAGPNVTGEHITTGADPEIFQSGGGGGGGGKCLLIKVSPGEIRGIRKK